MLRIDKKDIYHENYGWLDTRDAFKIEEKNIQLRVQNRAHIIILQTNK